MRKDPALDPPSTTNRKSTERHTETRKYSLLTPMFGGGAVTRQADEDLVIRGSSIRGHLRFWWRATRGFALGSLEEMRRRENEIFGSTDQPSAVKVHVQILNPGRPESPYKWIDGKAKPAPNIAPAYLSFPLQPDQHTRVGSPLSTVLVGVRFEVTYSYANAYREDMDRALWAWETFGGVGARTRRGFGAIQNDDSVRNEIQVASELDKLVPLVDRPLPGVSRIEGPSMDNIAFTKEHTTPHGAWEALANCYKEFRQDRPPGSNNRPGRSRWPEPDCIRNITGTWSAGHKPVTGAKDQFPRAFLGLPIITKFKGDTPQHGQTPEPQVTTLEPADVKGEKIDRRASPLIFRVMKTSKGKFVGLACLLRPLSLPPGGLKLVDNKDKNVLWESGPLAHRTITSIPHANGQRDYPFGRLLTKIRKV